MSAGLRYNVIAALLRLSKCRSQYLIGKALAEYLPTEDLWEGFMNDPENIAQFQALADVAVDIRAAMDAVLAADPEAVQSVVEQHYDRGLEAVELLAEELTTDPHNLLTVLVND